MGKVTGIAVIDYKMSKRRHRYYLSRQNNRQTGLKNKRNNKVNSKTKENAPKHNFETSFITVDIEPVRELILIS